MNMPIDARIQFAGAVFLMLVLSGWLIRRILHRRARQLDSAAPADERPVLVGLVRAAVAPLVLGVWAYGLQFIADLALDARWLEPDWVWATPALHHVARLGVFAAGLWFFMRLTRVLDRR